MKLGNTNGNNKGKKYFIRGKHDQHQPIEEHRIKAQEFNNWFNSNCLILINFLIMKNSFDEDVFNTTFLNMSEKILFTGMNVKDYRAYFHRAYYTNYIQDKTKEARYCQMASYETSEYKPCKAIELEREQARLETDIFEYVYERYDVQEFELFRMYVNLKPAINYEGLSEITHIKKHNIQRIISKILMDIRRNQVFLSRYRDIG